MKDKFIGIGVLFLGIASLGLMVLAWSHLALKERALTLESEALNQHSFELSTATIGEMGFPLILEKRTGVSYKLTISDEFIGWSQLPYITTAGETLTQPFSKLTPAVREKLRVRLDQLKQSKAEK